MLLPGPAMLLLLPGPAMPLPGPSMLLWGLAMLLPGPAMLLRCPAMLLRGLAVPRNGSEDWKLRHGSRQLTHCRNPCLCTNATATLQDAAIGSSWPPQRSCNAKFTEQEKAMRGQFWRRPAPQCCNLRCEAQSRKKQWKDKVNFCDAWPHNAATVPGLVVIFL